MVSNVAQEEIVAKTITRAARKTYRVQRGYVDYEDLMQEGWLWVAENPERVEQWLEDDDTKNHRLAGSLLYGAIRPRMHRYAMKQRYLKDGTRPRDYQFYNRAMVEELLPEVLDGMVAGKSSSDMSDAQVRGTRAANEGWEREATVADLQSALKSLPLEDRKLLYNRFADGGVSTEVLATQLQVTQRSVQRRIESVIGKMINHLGGTDPTVRRKARSNSASQVATRRQEAGE
jgi:RNA polymerase sigma factor (sigma-70 family)